MELRRDRLRRGEVVAGLAGGALLTFSFAPPPGAGGPPGETRRVARPSVASAVVVMAAVSGLALAFLQAQRRAPALPVTISVFGTTLGALATLVLLVRVARRRPGAAPALAAAAALTAGAFTSLRQEDGWVPDAAHPVERVPLTSASDPRA